MYAPRPAAAQQPPKAGSGKCPVTRLGQVLGVLAISGATTGTFLDSIHTKVRVGRCGQGGQVLPRLGRPAGSRCSCTS